MTSVSEAKQDTERLQHLVARVCAFESEKESPLDTRRCVRDLMYDFPEGLAALPVDLIQKLMIHFCSQRKIGSREIYDFYCFFQAGLRGHREQQPAFRDHCLSLQTAIAEMCNRDGRYFDRLYLVAEKYPEAFIGLDTAFLTSRIGRRINDFKKTPSPGETRVLHEVAFAAKVIAYRGGENIDQQLDFLFKPFGYTARVITRDRTTYSVDFVVIVSPYSGLSLQFRPSGGGASSSIIQPFAVAIDDMLDDRKHSQLYRNVLIPNIMRIISDLKEIEIIEGVRDLLENPTLIADAREMLAKRFRNSNDTSLRDTYRRFFPNPV